MAQILICTTCREAATQSMQYYNLDSDPTATNDVSLKEKLLYCVPEFEEILRNDDEDSWVCSDCCLALCWAYGFRKMCLDVKSTLEMEVIDPEVCVKEEVFDVEEANFIDVKSEPEMFSEGDCTYTLVEIENPDPLDIHSEDLALLYHACNTIPELKEANISPESFKCHVKLERLIIKKAYKRRRRKRRIWFNGVKRFICSICSTRFRSAGNLGNHLKKCRNKTNNQQKEENRKAPKRKRKSQIRSVHIDLITSKLENLTIRKRFRKPSNRRTQEAMPKLLPEPEPKRHKSSRKTKRLLRKAVFNLQQNHTTRNDFCETNPHEHFGISVTPSYPTSETTRIHCERSFVGGDVSDLNMTDYILSVLKESNPNAVMSLPPASELFDPNQNNRTRQPNEPQETKQTEATSDHTYSLLSREFNEKCLECGCSFDLVELFDYHVETYHAGWFLHQAASMNVRTRVWEKCYNDFDSEETDTAVSDHEEKLKNNKQRKKQRKRLTRKRSEIDERSKNKMSNSETETADEVEQNEEEKNELEGVHSVEKQTAEELSSVQEYEEFFDLEKCESINVHVLQTSDQINLEETDNVEPVTQQTSSESPSEEMIPIILRTETIQDNTSENTLENHLDHEAMVPESIGILYNESSRVQGFEENISVEEGVNLQESILTLIQQQQKLPKQDNGPPLPLLSAPVPQQNTQQPLYLLVYPSPTTNQPPLLITAKNTPTQQLVTKVPDPKALKPKENKKTTVNTYYILSTPENTNSNVILVPVPNRENEVLNEVQPSTSNDLTVMLPLRPMLRNTLPNTPVNIVKNESYTQLPIKDGTSVINPIKDADIVVENPQKELANEFLETVNLFVAIKEQEPAIQADIQEEDSRTACSSSKGKETYETFVKKSCGDSLKRRMDDDSDSGNMPKKLKTSVEVMDSLPASEESGDCNITDAIDYYELNEYLCHKKVDEPLSLNKKEESEEPDQSAEKNSSAKAIEVRHTEQEEGDQKEMKDGVQKWDSLFKLHVVDETAEELTKCVISENETTGCKILDINAIELKTDKHIKSVEQRLKEDATETATKQELKEKVIDASVEEKVAVLEFPTIIPPTYNDDAHKQLCETILQVSENSKPLHHCVVCNKTFTEIYALNLHTLEHKYEKPMEEVMNETQKRINETLEKMNNLRKYKCEKCCMSFSSSKVLKMHCVFKHGS